MWKVTSYRKEVMKRGRTHAQGEEQAFKVFSIQYAVPYSTTLRKGKVMSQNLEETCTPFLLKLLYVGAHARMQEMIDSM